MVPDDQLVTECPTCSLRCEPDQIWTDRRDREVSADFICPRCETRWSILTGAPELRLGPLPLHVERYDIEPEFVDLGAS